MNEKQEKYIEVLRATGNPSKARAAAGVSSRTVANWKQIEAFAEAFEDAQAAALDEIVEASRTAALAGDSAHLTNWLKIARPELRPQSSLAVGVRVDGGGSSVEDARLRRLQAMTDEQLLSEFESVYRDIQTRVEYGRHECVAAPAPAAGVIDVVATPVAQPEPEALSGPENEPESGDEGAVDDLL